MLLKTEAGFIGLFLFVIVFSFIPISEAELWDLIIEINVNKGNHPNQVEISGMVVDQAYKPISDAEIFIRSGSDTTKAFSDSEGGFTAEFEEFDRIPGTYTVNAIAKFQGKIGIKTTQYIVRGEVSPVSILEEQLSTNEARKYLTSNESDFEKNPIGQTLFKYYNGLLEKLNLEYELEREKLTNQFQHEQQIEISNNLRELAIAEFNPHAGTYGGYQYDDYINKLSPEIKDLIISQLNFTKNNFEEAQKIKEEILAKGGTYEEARQAYLDKISIPKEILEEFNQEYLNNKIEQKSEEIQTPEDNSETQ